MPNTSATANAISTRYGTWSKSRPLPIVVTSLNGTSRSSTPPVMSSAAPSDMPSVPSVTISGGIRAFATRKPLKMPHASPAASAPARPTRIVPQLSPPTSVHRLDGDHAAEDEHGADRQVDAGRDDHVRHPGRRSRAARRRRSRCSARSRPTTKLEYSRAEKTRIRATRIRPIRRARPGDEALPPGTRSGPSTSSGRTAPRPPARRRRGPRVGARAGLAHRERSRRISPVAMVEQ